MQFNGSCHCGAVKFEFEGEEIIRGLRCNCSICTKKGTLMTDYIISPEDMNISVSDDVLATYEFGTNVAKHHFCKICGIYTFHQTFRKPGHYRVNIGCVSNVDTNKLPFDVFDGASL